MSKVLVIHRDKEARGYLETLAKRRHEVLAAKDLLDGVRQMAHRRPDVVVVGHDQHKKHGLRLLKYMRENVLKTPVVVVVSPGAGESQPAMMKLGAKAFLEYPVDEQRLDAAIAAAVEARRRTDAGPPPFCDEELNGNLSLFERQLNRDMKCFAGRGLVYIQSMILGGATSRPRIGLRCPLRAEYGLSKMVYYEYIRDVCCGHPEVCEAYQRFRADQDN